MNTPAPKTPCPHCFGLGFVVDQTQLGRAIRQRRKRCELTARELARRTGIPICTLVYLEQGKLSWKIPQRDAVLAELVKEETLIRSKPFTDQPLSFGGRGGQDLCDALDTIDILDPKTT